MLYYHTSVLLAEAVAELKVKPGKKFIDGTLGGGGHTRAILAAGGKVLGLDVDEDAISYVKKSLSEKDTRILGEGKEENRLVSSAPNIMFARGNFRDIDQLAQEHGFGEVDGILLDLGVSSYQFDTAERGFSLKSQGPLDMRMDQSLSVTAKDLVNALTRDELTELFTKLGEERFAKKIAQVIVETRKIKPIETTAELETLVFRNVPKSSSGIHPATRVFQALRIAVNDELGSLRDVLPKAVGLLKPKGRLVIITFHSLEDRIVKHAFLEFESKRIGNIITSKPIAPSEEEMSANPRSRSAKMRVFEKT